jgi:arabinose-5-phosphate isomerase
MNTHKPEKEQQKQSGKQSKLAQRMQVLRAYGGPQPKCSCDGCGENKLEFLVIDINDGGYKHRTSVNNKLYRWLIKNNFPQGYKVSCWNCNSSYGLYGNCPHQKLAHNMTLDNQFDSPSDILFNSVIKSLNDIKSVLYTKEFNDLVILLTTTRSWATGVGKAALAAQKLSTTLASNGSPSAFIDTTEALHGNLGGVKPNELIVAFSNSGKTDQILELSYKAKDLGIIFVLITGDGHATIAKNTHIVIDYGKINEPCLLGLTPTTSTIIQLTIADALAMSVQRKRGLTYDEYSKFHGAGYLGYISKLKAELHGHTGKSDLQNG